MCLSGCAIFTGGDCGPWGEWQFDRTGCEPRFWCFFNNQEATYDYYYKERDCKKTVERRKKKKRRECGC